jgi:hypothetical protein
MRLERVTTRLAVDGLVKATLVVGTVIAVPQVEATS